MSTTSSDNPITAVLASEILRELTEAGLRDVKVPPIRELDDLAMIIEGLTGRAHDYGTAVYAMSIAAYAAFDLVARKVGASGFQGSCADMDFLRRTRGIKGPFTITDIENVLYPQYDVAARLSSFIEECAPWILEQAQAKLTEDNKGREPFAAPHVVAHWRALVANGGKLPPRTLEVGPRVGALLSAHRALLERYVALAADTGNLDPEQEPEVKAARAALVPFGQ